MMVEYKTLERIAEEVILGLSPARPDMPEEEKARRDLERDKAEADRRGHMLTFPTSPGSPADG